MSSFHVRPRFRQTIDASTEAIQEQIVKRVTEESPECMVKDFPRYVMIRIAEADQHFWSPRLTLSFEETEDGKTEIAGTYGPNANVWGIFLYSYLFVGTLCGIASVMSISQWAIGKQPTWIWLAVLGGLGLIAIYITAQVGQKIGAQQTFRLHQAYESAIGKRVEIN